MIVRLPDSNVHGANMGPTWVLSAPGGSHVGPMNLVIWADSSFAPINETVLFYKDVSYWQGASLESALYSIICPHLDAICTDNI